jgi:hypothetical protein
MQSLLRPGDHTITVGVLLAEPTDDMYVFVRIKVTSKFVSHFIVQSSFWKSVQSNLKLKHMSSLYYVCTELRILSNTVKILDAMLNYLYNPKSKFLDDINNRLNSLLRI